MAKDISYYIIMFEGDRMMATGPFASRKIAMEKAAQLSDNLHARIIEEGKAIERLPSFTFWSKFMQTEYVSYPTKKERV